MKEEEKAKLSRAQLVRQINTWQKRSEMAAQKGYEKLRLEALAYKAQYEKALADLESESET